MAQNAGVHSQTGSERSEPGRWFSRREVMERPILLLRGLALLLVLILHLFDQSTAGVIVPVPQMVLILVGYNLLLILFGVLTYGLDERIPPTTTPGQGSMGQHTLGDSGGQILKMWPARARQPKDIRPFGAPSAHTEGPVGRGGL